jgi:3-hydroxyisobutyrate dehydrogenase-like beta-hydroxyacid dehydrogenase
MTGSSVTVGLLHPGEMGTTVGATVVAGGTRVVWASEGRSPATQARARESGLEDVGTQAALARASQVILSVVPPHGAVDLARSVAALGFRGRYVDANAVAPETTRQIGRVIEAAGGRFVDGGIVGPPAHRRGTTRLYLSGPDAPEIASLFAAGPLDAIALDGPAGAASAVKVAYAGWNKGSQALLAAIRAFAIAEGVDAALLAEWKISKPEVPALSERAFTDNLRKAWRFVGEMDEIAASLARVGLPSGFHEAAHEIYERLADYKDASAPPPTEEAAARLLRPSPRPARSSHSG